MKIDILCTVVGVCIVVLVYRATLKDDLVTSAVQRWNSKPWIVIDEDKCSQERDCECGACPSY